LRDLVFGDIAVKRILISSLIGFVVIASLWSFAWYGAKHQDHELLSVIAYVVAGIIDLPVIAIYGVGGGGGPPLVSIAIYLAEAGIISAFVYIILFVRKG
jgi:hypothetical protein